MLECGRPDLTPALPHRTGRPAKLMSPSRVPLIVVTTAEDEVELINKTLRDAGHPAHCHWIKRLDGLGDAIDTVRPELLIFCADRFETPVDEIAKLRLHPQGAVPLLVL